MKTKGMDGSSDARWKVAPPSVRIWTCQGSGECWAERFGAFTAKTGVVSTEIPCGITSLTPAPACAVDLKKLWREHWAIGNRVDYVRDVTLGEDGGQPRTGDAPYVLIALHNVLLNLYRAHGWRNISDAVRNCGSKISHVLNLIFICPARL